MTCSVLTGGVWGACQWLALWLLVLAPFRVALAAGAEREAAILSRALSFERTLNDRVGKGPIGFAILHKAQDPASEQCAGDWRDGFATLARVKIQGRAVTFQLLPYSADAVGGARANGTHVFVVCPGLSQEAVEITRASRAQRILTVGAVLPYIEQNMTFGVFREQERYRMVVNLYAAAAEGVTFSSGMLSLARIIR